jgi:hypothetical protein
MKFLVMAAVMLFVSLGSVQAQSIGGGGSVGDGGGINSATSISHAIGINGGGGAAPAAASSAPTAKNVSGTNPGEFVPSTFESYGTALTMGQNAGHARPLSVAEAARMAQRAKLAANTKPTIILDKDAQGKLVVVQANQAVPANQIEGKQ